MLNSSKRTMSTQVTKFGKILSKPTGTRNVWAQDKSQEVKRNQLVQKGTGAVTKISRDEHESINQLVLID